MFTGLSAEEMSNWMPLVEDAVLCVRNMLKDDVDEDANCALLSSAAAYYAYYKWCVINTDSQAKSFRAGDVAFSEQSRNTSVESALVLWQNSLKEISHLTKDSNFFFRGVKI